jgi:hypothetical protein
MALDPPDLLVAVPQVGPLARLKTGSAALTLLRPGHDALRIQDGGSRFRRFCQLSGQKHKMYGFFIVPGPQSIVVLP